MNNVRTSTSYNMYLYILVLTHFLAEIDTYDKNQEFMKVHEA